MLVIQLPRKLLVYSDTRQIWTAVACVLIKEWNHTLYLVRR